MRFSTPNHEGFFWAKWKIADEGTDKCSCCGRRHSEWEDGLSHEDWVVVEVVENCIDETDPEHLMVMVGGVTQWQSLENFFWGPEIAKPKEIL